MEAHERKSKSCTVKKFASSIISRNRYCLHRLIINYHYYLSLLINFLHFCHHYFPLPLLYIHFFKSHIFISWYWLLSSATSTHKRAQTCTHSTTPHIETTFPIHLSIYYHHTTLQPVVRGRVPYYDHPVTFAETKPRKHPPLYPWTDAGKF